MASIESLPDSVIVYIFAFLPLRLLSRCSKVCRKWRRLCYDVSLWRKITFWSANQSKVNDDLLKRLISRRTNCIQVIDLKDCELVTDASLKRISTHCPHLRKLGILGCKKISDQGLLAVASNCSKLISAKVAVRNVTEKSVVALINNNPNLLRLYAYSRAVTAKTCSQLMLFCHRLEVLVVYESHLEKHDSSKSDVLSDRMVTCLAVGCRRLRKLVLHYNQVLVTDEALLSLSNKCPGMESLIIDYVDREDGITDIGVAAVAKFCNLRRLNLSNGLITDSACLFIAKNLPNLEDLSFEFCRITDTGIYSIMRSCENLRRLTVHSDGGDDGNYITDLTARIIANFAHEDFFALGLGFSNLSNEGLKMITESTDLGALSVNGCEQITFKGLKESFNNLACLGYLDISFTDIIEKTEQLLEIGKAFPWLHTLDLTDCFGVTKESLKHFKVKFPDCKVIR